MSAWNPFRPLREGWGPTSGQSNYAGQHPTWESSPCRSYIPWIYLKDRGATWHRALGKIAVDGAYDKEYVRPHWRYRGTSVWSVALACSPQGARGISSAPILSPIRYSLCCGLGRDGDTWVHRGNSYSCRERLGATGCHCNGNEHYHRRRNSYAGGKVS